MFAGRLVGSVGLSRRRLENGSARSYVRYRLLGAKPFILRSDGFWAHGLFAFHRKLGNVSVKAATDNHSRKQCCLPIHLLREPLVGSRSIVPLLQFSKILLREKHASGY